MTRRNKERLHKLLHPRLHGSGTQTGGSLIMSTRLKDGPITDKSGQPDEIGDQPSLCGKSLIVQMNSKFLGYHNR